MPDVKHFDPDAALDTAMRLFWRKGFAATGMQDVVTATRVHRSSLYATFGGKKELYVVALRRYVDAQSLPAFDQLAGGTGLPAIRAFFAELVAARCHGPQAGFGCLVANAHAGQEVADPEVREVLALHHERLRQAMTAALATARRRGQVRGDLDPGAAAGALALLAYGINVRSRAGAAANELSSTIDRVLVSFEPAKDGT